MSTRLADLPHGVVEQLHRKFASKITGVEAQRLHDYPEVWDAMFESMRAHPINTLIHCRFTPLADKIAMVKGWPGVVSAEVDAAVQRAYENGTIELYEAQSPGNPWLDLVIVVYLLSLLDTLLYGRARMMEAWSSKYGEWNEVYALQEPPSHLVEMIPGREFSPLTIEVQAVDFGANWVRQGGETLGRIQSGQAARLADFAALFNASQSPYWVKQMDGKKVPFATLPALVLNPPKIGPRQSSPLIQQEFGRGRIGAHSVNERCWQSSAPVVLRKDRG